ncbi:GldG family protein [Deferribacter thermophilus]|uniref:GldG family protein n=1 Tax=Deferribacter thermophilus TaxID=53573 RepID=UPI003C2A4CB2
MSRRQLINLISVLIIVIFANLFAARYYYKLDLTENKIYSISNATKKTLQTLKYPLHIKVIMSEDIPSPYNSKVRFFLDILEEYKAFQTDKIKLEIIQGAPIEIEKVANLYGIPPVQVNAIESDSLQIKKIYMGAVIIYGDKTETIPVIANVNIPEYELTSLIKQMNTDKKKAIAIIDAGKSATNINTLRTIAQSLSKNYEIENVKIEKGKLIDKKFDAALLISPIEKLKPFEQYAIQEFLFSGKNLILALDKVDGDIQSGYAFKKDLGIEKFLEKNGIKLTDKLIYDANATLINISRNVGGFYITTAVKYPFFPEIINFDREDLFTKGVTSVNMIYPTLVEIDNKSALKIKPFMFTSEFTGIETEPYNVALDKEYNKSDFNKQKLPVGFYIEGKFKTDFTKPLEEYKDTFKKEGNGKLILFADGEMFKDDYITSGDNLKLINNIIDYLMADNELLELRGKTVKYHPIKLKNPESAIYLKYFILLFPPVLVVIIGIIIIKLSRRRVRL